MNVVIFSPDKDPIKLDGNLTFDEIQRLVDGYVEIVRFGDYILACDEEGRLRSKQPCISVRLQGGHFMSFVGTVVICKEQVIDSDNVIYQGLSSSEIKDVSNKIYLFRRSNNV